MPGALVGYEFLREHLATNAFPLSRPAAIFPVTKVTSVANYLQVLSAENAVLTQRRQAADLATRALQNQVALARALGGVL